MLHRNNDLLPAPFPREQNAEPGGWRNLPTNCQAQDISKYRYILLRAISRNRLMTRPIGIKAVKAGGRVKRLPGTKQPLWNGLPLTADIGSVLETANDR